MTEAEKVKAEIKVLESKIALLKAIAKHKQPEEAAYFRAYGLYPMTDVKCNPRDIWRLDRWTAFRTGYKSATKDWKVMDAGYQPTPQEPEEVAEGLEQAFKQAVEQGVVPRVKEAHRGKQVIDRMAPLAEALKEEPPNFLTIPLEGTLEVIIRDWWDHVFGVAYGTKADDRHINDLVHRIEAWLPKPQSAAGSQNGYVECTVDGFNDCLEQIKRKLR